MKHFTYNLRVFYVTPYGVIKVLLKRGRKGSSALVDVVINSTSVSRASVLTNVAEENSPFFLSRARIVRRFCGALTH